MKAAWIVRQERVPGFDGAKALGRLECLLLGHAGRLRQRGIGPGGDPGHDEQGQAEP